MRPNKARYVTVCQQLLALGAVFAVLAPAADVVSLDITHGAPAAPAAALASSPLGDQRARVSTAPVKPTVDEVAFADTSRNGGTVATASSSDLAGYSAVGVTWSPQDDMAESEISIEVRTRGDEGWTGWEPVEYHAEEGPDPDSAEARSARPGTDPMFVGEVQAVQVRTEAAGGLPADLQLSVVSPGEDTATDVQSPAIDTSAAEATAAASAPAAAPTSKPKIFSRAQWGADERLRDPSSLHYFEVHAGIVHHTVNANSYSRSEVPSIIRSIYAYHTQSRGWSDIGYNFLIDRFGRTWEGRYGGVARPVVAAHTSGYNDDAFGVSAIGNFEETRPSKALVEAEAKLMAWKLSLHGVSPTAKRQRIAGDIFPAIIGHRDAGQTACPGVYLYNKIDAIRKRAQQLQNNWSGRERKVNLFGKGWPDLIARRASDGQAVVLPSMGTKPARPAGFSLKGARQVLNVGDWDRDRRGDVIIVRGGKLFLRLGKGDGTFAAPTRIARGFRGVRMLTAVGDMTGDGFMDLMGQPKGGSMRIYPGNGAKGLSRSYVAYRAVQGGSMIGPGRWDKDGSPDVLVRNGSRLTMYAGNGPGGLTGSRSLSINLGAYDWVLGLGDVTGNAHADLVVRERATGNLYALTGSRSGFGSRSLLAKGKEAYNLVG